MKKLTWLDLSKYTYKGLLCLSIILAIVDLLFNSPEAKGFVILLISIPLAFLAFLVWGTTKLINYDIKNRSSIGKWVLAITALIAILAIFYNFILL